MSPLLYLDFDGLLHPADVRVSQDTPRQPVVYFGGRPSRLPLFEHMGLLEQLLAPHPDLAIVLSTSWVRAFGYEFALQQLSPGLRARVIGATWHAEMKCQALTRFDSIADDAAQRGINRWLALDDDVQGWPDDERHRVVAPTNPLLALAQPGVPEEVTAMLAALCSGRPLELTSNVAAVPSTMDRLFNGAI